MLHKFPPFLMNFKHAVRTSGLVLAKLAHLFPVQQSGEVIEDLLYGFGHGNP
jgi:hypothetical protein